MVLVVWHGGLILRDERRLLGVLEVRQWSEADDRGGGAREVAEGSGRPRRILNSVCEAARV